MLNKIYKILVVTFLFCIFSCKTKITPSLDLTYLDNNLKIKLELTEYKKETFYGSLCLLNITKDNHISFTTYGNLFVYDLEDNIPIMIDSIASISFSLDPKDKVCIDSKIIYKKELEQLKKGKLVISPLFSEGYIIKSIK